MLKPHPDPSVIYSFHYYEPYVYYREARGANQYLTDVIDLFESFKWSWTYYSFREEAFPHTDLELQGWRNERAVTPLFEIIQKALK